MNKAGLKLFDETGMLNSDSLSDENIQLKPSSRTRDLLEILMDDKLYLITTDKRSIPGLEGGVDSISYSTYFNKTKYFHIKKDNVDYWIDIEGNYYPGLEEGFEENSRFIKNLKTDTYNLRDGNGELLLDERCDGYAISESTIKMYLFKYKTITKFAIEEYGILKIIEGSFDSVAFFNNPIDKQTNDGEGGYKELPSQSIMAKKDGVIFLYDQEGQLITRAGGIDEKKLGTLIASDTGPSGRGEIVTMKNGKYFLYYLNDNSEKLLSKKSGADNYKPVKDHVGRNRYWLLRYGKKHNLLNGNDGGSAIEFSEKGFDKFDSVEHVHIPPADTRDLSKDILYANIKNGDKTYLLDMDTFKNYGDNHIGKILSDGFDTIKQIFPISYNPNNASLLFSPVLVSEGEQLYLFDQYGKSTKELDDAKIDELIDTEDDSLKIIKKDNKCYILRRNYDPAKTIMSDYSFDSYIGIISDDKIEVQKGGEKHILDVETLKFIAVGDNTTKSVNQDILDSFTNEEDDILPF